MGAAAVNERSLSLLLKTYKAVVIGAGPSGLAALANLLDANVHPLLWVDPAFESGRLSKYESVPSNTKVQLFIDFALASPTLSYIVNNTRPSPVDHLRALDPKSTCLLQNAVKMICGLTDGVKRHFSHKVHFFQGHALDAVHSHDKNWSLYLSNSGADGAVSSVSTSGIILATGSHPTPSHSSWAPHQRYGPAGKSAIEELSLETALDPQVLSATLSSSDVVAVVGGSHSAILCLKNLAELRGNKPQKIVHYYRDQLKYAVEMDGWILYDNTGLKGNAATWAKEVLEKGLVPNLESHFLGQDAATEAEIYKTSLNQVTKIIYAIGFRRNPLPKLVVDGVELKPESVKYLAKTGKITDLDRPLPGLWGYGIAFPEETVDPHGNREFAVGLWKFMRYLTKTIHEEVVPELLGNDKAD